MSLTEISRRGEEGMPKLSARLSNHATLTSMACRSSWVRRPEESQTVFFMHFLPQNTSTKPKH